MRFDLYISTSAHESLSGACEMDAEVAEKNNTACVKKNIYIYHNSIRKSWVCMSVFTGVGEVF